MRVRTMVIAMGLAGASAASPVAGTWAQALFSAHSDLVVLHVSVKDRKGAPVMALTADAFTVKEDGRPQVIQFFGTQDAPVTVGLIIDGSGSMRLAREQIGAAAAAFVESSNPEDQVFALAFNEHVRLVLPPALPFTSDPDVLRAAVRGAISAKGRTALHDAVLAGLDYASRGDLPRRVLVVLGDGGDNASAAGFDDVLSRIHASNTVVYTMAFGDPLDSDANPRRLRLLAEASGGEAFAPRTLTAVVDALREIARDIRNIYTIGYVPPPGAVGENFRRVQVNARGRDGHTLVVRTRRGYLIEER